MNRNSYLPPSLVRVEKIALRGPGVVILTGPSSCGKGEVAQALCEMLSIDPERHLSMGGILRKVRRYQPELQKLFNRDISADGVSQLEWLEFCTIRGLLIPNRWTQDLISAEIDTILQTKNNDGTDSHGLPFILDGYPRTVAAAEHLLGFLNSVNVPVLKVLHFSISKDEMRSRAGKRGRADDHEEALRSRFEFYVENVQPSVDYMKTELGGSAISLIDAHQPEFYEEAGLRKLNLLDSIDNVVSTSLRALGVPRVIVRDLLEARRERRQEKS